LNCKAILATTHNWKEKTLAQSHKYVNLFIKLVSNKRQWLHFPRENVFLLLSISISNLHFKHKIYYDKVFYTEFLLSIIKNPYFYNLKQKQRQFFLKQNCISKVEFLKSIFLIIIIIISHYFIIKITSLSFRFKKFIFENEIKMRTSKTNRKLLKILWNILFFNHGIFKQN
jgi:hypothetical protein